MTSPVHGGSGIGDRDRPLLEVAELSIEFDSAGVAVRAVSSMSFDIGPGETVALVGESGSGKTTTALAVLGLLPPRTRIAGHIRWRDRDLLGLGHAELRALRGREIGLIPQDPMSALHPLIRIDAQVAEAITSHDPGIRSGEARARAAALLARMGVPAERLADGGYPHQWSGGMRQRALIAMAIANRPDLIIADEPTTALDAATQADVLALLQEVGREAGAALLLITHDLGVVSELADRVVVMRAGRMVESGSARSIVGRPDDPYTRALVAAATRSEARTTPNSAASGEGPQPPSRSGPGALLSVDGLVVRYRLDRGFARRSSGWLTAVGGVDFELAAGEILGMVGESGAGKSTLARALVGLERAAAGRILVGGHDLARASGAALRAARAAIQIVFQDHASSLNPRRRVGATVVQPLFIHGRLRRRDAGDRAAQLLAAVGLPASYVSRYPHELSGGERQRVAIARALALEPRVLVLDEPVTSLDALARHGVLQVLRTLREERGLAILLIAHDLHLIRGVADRVAIVHRGRIVETGPTAAVFAGPAHDATRRLLGVSRRPVKRGAAPVTE